MINILLRGFQAEVINGLHALPVTQLTGNMTTEDNSVVEQVKCYQMRACLSNVLRAVYNVHGRTLNVRLNAVCNQSTQHRAQTLTLGVHRSRFVELYFTFSCTLQNSLYQLTDRARVYVLSLWAVSH